MNPPEPKWMQLALDLARQGQGLVEPNPMVGCVLVRNEKIVGQGFHKKFGEAHAEVNAIASCDNCKGTDVFVTLEPCCHQGKTGPCTRALIEAGVAKVVIATMDPFSEAGGRGIQQLESAGIEVDCGLHEADAIELNRPYFKRVKTGMPWVIAKWAMTLDGKIATASGSSQWISNEQSRQIVHELRGRMDAIVVGFGTALADDPLLTARPPGNRTALRVVLDSNARLPLDSKLISTAREYPVAVAVGPEADRKRCDQLEQHGCQIIECAGDTYGEQTRQLLSKLGELNFTNVLVEGGSTVLGVLGDADLIDEVHCFIAPKIVGGKSSPSPIAGTGVDRIADARQMDNLQVQKFGTDIYISGRLNRTC